MPSCKSQNNSRQGFDACRLCDPKGGARKIACQESGIMADFQFSSFVQEAEATTFENRFRKKYPGFNQMPIAYDL